MKKIFIGTLMILAISSTGFAKMHDFQNEPTPPVPPHMMKMKNNNYRVNEKPDWNKIEKLNIEIATQEAKNRTCTMRERFEARFNTQTSTTPINN